MWQKLKTIYSELDLQSLYAKLGGRSFLVIVFFAATAFILAWYNKLSPEYSVCITALSGWHCGRAVFQDYHDRNGGGGN